jgi:hypothetical protein
MQLTTAFTLITGSIIAVVHYLAMSLELYWRYWWLDIPMHVVGGVFILLLWATMIDLRVVTRSSMRVKTAVIVVGIVIVLWEVFGVVVEQGFKVDFVTDTSIDLLCGAVGGAIGYILVRVLYSLSI